MEKNNERARQAVKERFGANPEDKGLFVIEESEKEFLYSKDEKSMKEYKNKKNVEKRLCSSQFSQFCFL